MWLPQQFLKKNHTAPIWSLLKSFKNSQALLIQSDAQVIPNLPACQDPDSAHICLLCLPSLNTQISM